MTTRSKSLPIRSSRDPYLSLPEEANQRDGTGKGIESGDDADVEIVTDTFDGKKKRRHCLGTSGTDRGGGSHREACCIVCEISDESVSKCSGADCLLWFHEECLNAEFGSGCGCGGGEDLYCPYCWFRILAVKSVRLKEKAVEADMAVFKYLDEEMENRGESVPKEGREDSVDTTDIVSDQELEGERQRHTDESRGGEEDMELIEPEDNFEVNVDKAVDDNEKVAATENFQDAEDEETAGDRRTKANAGGAGKERDFSPFLSVQESFSGKEQDQVQQSEKRRRKRRLILNAFDSDVSSNGSTNEPNGEDAAEKMTSLALVVTSPSGRMTKNQQREDSRTTKVDNSKTTTVRDIPIFKMEHKRRLLWTPEEEYMLKVGVEKFAAEAKKNMPWRKILEMGQKVFHETRTPTDLKDKWRNMTGARQKNKQDSTSVSGM
ncbi:uncharacterized protein LOC108825563 [Raphanus sativus]|uniref:Uncharacterized protein LOC108825563 n=1 Tax=Raphanus sativus TaxID=3726 RepID=A0A9W3CHF8_RAPSA|nr:uncharacterized protein LOC108825563 [Raphanus sativus]XP_056851031.1 uncharacterized protein LOC108825563 [Raphanus sativus]